jgi:hypothetical protein
MSIDQIRHKVIASVWQAIAQSEVNLSTIPQDQQEKLVGKIADSVMLAVDEILDQQAEPPPETETETGDEFAEHVLWEGRPFLSLNDYYVLTNDRLKIRRGLLGREIENYELIRIQDIDFEQGITERMLGIGDIRIHGHDPSDPAVQLRNVQKPEMVYETIRRAWLEARKRHGLQFSEFM